MLLLELALTLARDGLCVPAVWQVVAASNGFTWKEAAIDASTRCFGGRAGTLATPTSADANNALHRVLYAALGSDDGDEDRRAAWLGAIEVTSAPAKKTAAVTSTYSWVRLSGHWTCSWARRRVLGTDDFWVQGLCFLRVLIVHNRLLSSSLLVTRLATRAWTSFVQTPLALDDVSTASHCCGIR